MTAHKILLSWSDVIARVRQHVPAGARVFGIPRGGSVVAGLAEAVVQGVVAVADPSEATCIVDDIVDSGRTAQGYRSRFPGLPVVALIDKPARHEDAALPWVVFPWETMSESGAEETVVRQLQLIGEDPTREGLRDTPRRYLSALTEMTNGLKKNPASVLGTMFDSEGYDQIVVVQSEFASLCEHHLLPFTGTVHFAYLPGEKIVGLSKIPRMVEALARRPQVQERLTMQIASVFDETVKPRGVAVVVRGEHSCMAVRGIRKRGEMTTSARAGVFADNPQAHAEALRLMGL